MLGSGPAMALLVPLVLGFVLMITAWTYCLRGWLAALMVNKRRRRAVIVGVTMSFLVCSQLPNLLTNVWAARRDTAAGNSTRQGVRCQAGACAAQQRSHRRRVDAAHCYVPLLWLPQGAKALAEHRPWPAVLGALGMAAIGALGLARAYRGTLRFYREAPKRRSRCDAMSPARTRGAGQRILSEPALPLVPEEAAAVALASFRSMSRAPEVKMALAANVFIFGAFGATRMPHQGRNCRTRPGLSLPAPRSPRPSSGLTQLMFNHFGFDRGGFQRVGAAAGVAPPHPAGQEPGLAAGGAGHICHVSRPGDRAWRTCGWPTCWRPVLICRGVLAHQRVGERRLDPRPYRIAAGSLRPTKVNGLTQLLIFLTHLLFPLAAAPVCCRAGAAAYERLGPLAGAVATPACARSFRLAVGPALFGAPPARWEAFCSGANAILQVVTQEVE